MRPILVLLLLASCAFGQIKLQPEYLIGQPIVIEVAYPDAPEGALPADIEWSVGESGFRPLGVSSIAVWPRFGLKDSTLTVRCSGPLVTADGKYVPRSNRTFEATTILRGIGPDPTPEPGPGPSPTPTPDGDAPIKEPGFRVLMVYESALPIPSWLNDADLRALLNEKCVAGANGVKEWRVVDPDSPTSPNAGVWPAALARPRTEVPWLLISTGTIGYEGPLPKTKAETFDLIKRYSEARR